MAARSPRSRRASLRLALATLLMLGSTLIVAVGPAAAANPFVDVSMADPAYTAIDQLYARGVLNGYPTTPRTFGPNDKSLRAQMAALIGRGMGYGIGYPNPFLDRCGNAGCVDTELWNYIGTLASRNVAKGYSPTTFGPFDYVLQQQVILFIARAKVDKGDWIKQPDDPRVYPGSAASISDHQDIVTYVHYAGAPPDAQLVFDTVWTAATTEATRGWFARALWQAYPEGKGIGLFEPPTPTPGQLPDTAVFTGKVLELTNIQRQQNNCGPVTFSFQLQFAAELHAIDMANHDYLSNTGKNGSSVDQRVLATGYQFGMVAENVAGGQATPEEVMAYWMSNYTSRTNILNCDLKQLGVGYYYIVPDTGAVNYNHYWVQVFATPTK